MSPAPVRPATAATTAEIDATLAASRALVAVAARSMAAVGEVTLPQFRLLVLLASRGPSSLGVLADELGVHASTFTRLTDRLVRKGLVRRVAGTEDRRSVVLHLDTAGRRIVDHVTKARRRELGSILSAMDAQQRELLRQSLEGFAQAAGEPMDSAWPVW